MAIKIKPVIHLANGEKYEVVSQSQLLNDGDMEKLLSSLGNLFAEASYVKVEVFPDNLNKTLVTKKKYLLLYGDSLKGSHITVEEKVDIG